ncbi:glycosyl transferase family 90 [Roseomonas sp. BN140053]|uniref:glycosyl transferase family 90 n=1 Tax=Roseomonas sp. BN140053 TaxID=3391898 RepID=UPI0039EBD20B
MTRRLAAEATMGVVSQEGGLRFTLLSGARGRSSRTVPTMRMLEALLAGRTAPLPPDGTFLFQYEDFASHDAPSLAYGKWRGEFPAVRLVPDTYFFGSRGYDATRQAAAAGALPPWQDREDRLFWRGSPTTRRVGDDGVAIDRLEQVLRVRLCRLLHGVPRTDAAMTGDWAPIWPAETVIPRFTEWGILRRGVPMLQHARYRYQLDIDGVANAWSLFDKLLMGSCILKVASPFEQWFYRWLRPWEHVVPVRADLSDLLEKLDWCFSHPVEAEAIGRRGQQLALSHSFEDACALARAAVRDCTLVT